MGPVGHVRMVLWSFIGIRGGAATDLSRVNPIVLTAVAVALAALFGLAVWGLAHLAAQSLAG